MPGPRKKGSRTSPCLQFNQNIFIGWLCCDPELISHRGQPPYVKLVMAVAVKVSKDWTFTDYHHVVVFPPGMIDVLCKYARKGDHILVVGCLRQRPRLLPGGRRYFMTARVEVYQGVGRVILLGVPKIFTAEIRELRLKQEEGTLDPKEQKELVASVTAAIDTLAGINIHAADEPAFTE
jgi:hypothetical protein